MDRREALKELFVLAATVGCGCCTQSAYAGWPGSRDTGGMDSEIKSRPNSGGWPLGRTRVKEPASSSDSFQSSEIGGCAVNLGNSISSRQFGLVASTGNAELDHRIRREAGFLRTTYGVRPGLTFFNDSRSPNALATPEPLLGDKDGTVLFGLNLVQSEISANLQSLGGGLMIILAHEWSHIYQFKNGVKASVPKMELQADLVAGWYVSARLLHQTNIYGPTVIAQANLEVLTAAKSLFDKGDFKFNHPQHHGTPRQRYRAMEKGLELALKGVSDINMVYQAGAKHVGIG